jgi:hypothetical protein
MIDWAAAQRDLLQRAAGRAQRDVPDPDADHLVAALNIISGPDHAGEGQGRDIAILRTMGSTQGAIMRHFPDHRLLDRRHGHDRGFLLGVVVCLNVESIRQFLSWLTRTELFSPELYFLLAPAGRDGCRRDDRRSS